MIAAKMGYRNFWRQKARNIYALLSVIIGCTSLILLGGYTNRWENTLMNDAIYLRSAGSLSIYKKDGQVRGRSKPKKYSFSQKELSVIQKELGSDPEVEHIGEFLTMTGLVSNGCYSQPFEVIGYDPLLDQKLRAKPEVQRWCSDLVGFKKGESFARTAKTNVVGLATGLSSLLGKSTVLSEAAPAPMISDLKSYCEGEGARERIAADPNVQLMGLTFDGHFGAVDADVAHIFSTGSTMQEDIRLTAPLSLVRELYQTERASHVAVYLKDHARARALLPRFEERLKAAGLDVEIFAWNEKRISPFYHGVMSFIHAMHALCTVLIGSVVALCVINLTTMNVLERSREIGMLKALGFRSGTISRLFAAEATVVALVGSALGVLLALALCSYFNQSGIRFHPPGFAGSVNFMLVPNMAAVIRVVFIVLTLVLASSALTSYFMSRRSSFELLTQKDG